MNQIKHYYSQGFKFSRSVSVVDFIQTFNENKIVPGSRTKIYFMPGATTNDFKDQCQDIYNYVEIDSNKTISPKRNLKLEAKIVKFNKRQVFIYDLDGRVINYLVASDVDTTLLEDSRSTVWIINPLTADNPEQLSKIVYKSKYVFWESLPCKEYYSYKYVNTTAAKSLEDSKPKVSSGSPVSDYPPISNNPEGDSSPGVISTNNTPLNFAKFSKWRLDYARVLVGFYEAIQAKLPGYEIYLDGNEIPQDGSCIDKLSSKRIDIDIQGFANMNHHPWIYEHDLYQMKADLGVTISTSDQLEYMHNKKKFQNYEFLSDVVRYYVNDKYDLPWMCHIWWEPYQDQMSLRQAKDEQGRFSFVLPLRCQLHFYEVEDEFFHIIDQIRVIFQNLPEKPEYVFKLKDF